MNETNDPIVTRPAVRLSKPRKLFVSVIAIVLRAIGMLSKTDYEQFKFNMNLEEQLANKGMRIAEVPLNDGRSIL